ncbi:hypothetical protein HIM_08253 [Hirsutella minnesotensis 3608]|uniref:Peptidase A1 domain-containing protein n=1 Tax=Hirsutella minnesotensis 3608 TaxID=1043627 RepID=A0A0F7ZYE4_9HYPO|nr:hypothetical protein HIM_08253 [Hirsutella minnesotensis 3608]
MVRGLKAVESDLMHFHNHKFGPWNPMMVLELGSGKQPVLAQLDTGSSDLIFAQKNSAICEKQREDCQDIPAGAGAFDPEVSRDTENLRIPFNTSFVSGESFIGNFIKTSISFGSSTVTETQVGLYNDGNQPGNPPLYPIFGSGSLDKEGADDIYPNIPQRMKDTGVINTNAYSVYLNDFRGSNGSILFGGVDRAKFEGELQDVPLIKATDVIGDTMVEFSSLQLLPGSRNNQTARTTSNCTMQPVNLSPERPLPPAFLDTGGQQISLPADVVQRAAKMLGAPFDEKNGMGPIDCRLAYSGAALQFGFNQNKAIIKVPLDMTLNAEALAKDNVCLPDVIVAEGEDANVATLGPAMMQAAYVVHDFDQGKLMMAQARFNVTESNVEELPVFAGSKQQDEIEARARKDRSKATQNKSETDAGQCSGRNFKKREVFSSDRLARKRQQVAETLRRRNERLQRRDERMQWVRALKRF